MAVEPLRHQLFEWERERGPGMDSPGDQAIMIGPVLGAGAYTATYEVIQANGRKGARSMLYPHVRQRAKGEFEILARTAADLAQRDRRFWSLLDMVRQARLSSESESWVD